MIKNYIITLDVKSPVFIGSGNEISKKDCLYLNNEKMVYVLDNIKLFNGIKKAGMLKNYEDFLMDSRQKNFSMFTKNNNIPLRTVKSWASYSLPMNDITDIEDSRKKGGGSDNILTFVKDKFGCPYIPGSSLKGAIRTVIQNALCMERSDDMEKIRHDIETEQFTNKKKYMSSPEKKISSDLFFNLNRKERKRNDILNDTFAGIRISDSNPLDVSSLILCQKVDMKTDGTYTSLPIKRECIKPGTKVTFSLETDTEMMNISPEVLCGYAKKVFSEYKTIFLDKFKNTNIASSDCTTPVIIGGGSGYVSKTTVYSLYKDKQSALRTVQKIMIDTTSTKNEHDPHNHTNDSRKYHVSPHIRKCTMYNGRLYDMGICDLSITEI